VKDKILTVHSRGAEKETIQCLAAAEVTAILHWYSGALTHIDTAVEAGLWFSVNSAMLRSKTGQRIIRSIPRERIVTETDGPYVKVGGQASEPRDIPRIVNGLANIWNEDPVYARDRVLDTMRNIAMAARGADNPSP
jgi:TatD DNase family protein